MATTWFRRSTSEGAREARLRRLAWRNGFTLRNSRIRTPYTPGYGGWWVINPYINGLVCGGEWGWSLDDVESWLTDYERS